jgi:hypothetical protein
MDIQDVHVCAYTRFFYRYMHIYADMYVYLYVLEILFRFVSPNFLTNFAERELNMALAKRNFGEISFRDETEKVYFGETILHTSQRCRGRFLGGGDETQQSHLASLNVWRYIPVDNIYIYT